MTRDHFHKALCASCVVLTRGAISAPLTHARPTAGHRLAVAATSNTGQGALARTGASAAASQGVTPAAAAQPLTIIGSGSMSGLTAPGASVVAVPAVSVTSTRVLVDATLANNRSWQVVITNPRNDPSAAFPFNVA